MDLIGTKIQKLVLLRVCKHLLRHVSVGHCSQSAVENAVVRPNAERTFATFDDVLDRRRDQAKRSVIVQVKNMNSYDDLMSHCSRIGAVRSAYHYTLTELGHYVLLEMDDHRATEILLESSSFANNEALPVHSPMLWLRSIAQKSIPKATTPCMDEPIELPSASEIDDAFSKSSSFSDDMQTLYERTKLNELGIRLRFITAMQVETAFSGMFPHAKVLPFGSSINGFGKIGCDLDLVMELNSKQPSSAERLVFHAKTMVGANRNHNQKHLEVIADVLQYYLPGCSQIKRILLARVPILRYKQEITGIDCDLSTTNLTGVYMSELLYMWSTYDSRVTPLVFTVRYWAKEMNLTNAAPGRWVTNFMLTLMVLFYLQRERLLPTLDQLVQKRRPEDTRVAENDIDCSFLRDLQLLPQSVESNTSSLLTLLFGFFQFYSTFDFGSYAISLNSGTIIPKPEYASLYIVNPLEKYLNVSKNVSADECERMRMHFRNAAWTIESSVSKDAADKHKWGLRHLIRDQDRTSLPHRSSGIGPKFAVKDLFGDPDLHKINWK